MDPNGVLRSPLGTTIWTATILATQASMAAHLRSRGARRGRECVDGFRPFKAPGMGPRDCYPFTQLGGWSRDQYCSLGEPESWSPVPHFPDTPCEHNLGC